MTDGSLKVTPMVETIVIFVLILMFACIWLWDFARRQKRRATLYRDETGFYVWVDFDGRKCRSRTHPEKPGGAWYSHSGYAGGDAGGLD
ncbi:MAG: hypothetical protein ACFB11_06900 [Paracoccaceae bacterium]